MDLWRVVRVGGVAVRIGERSGERIGVQRLLEVGEETYRKGR